MSTDIATGDELGRAAAADGGTIVVGAPHHDQGANDASTACVSVAGSADLTEDGVRPGEVRRHGW